MKNLFLSIGSTFFPGFVVVLFLVVHSDAAEGEHHGNVGQAHEEGYVIVVHGGATTLSEANIPPEMQEAYFSSLGAALQVGAEALEHDGSALDAVEAVIRFLEDDSLFNAGKGAVLNDRGMPELDASIMDGRDLNAGAVARVSQIRNPISAARAVMEQSGHVMLDGDGAEVFAQSVGLENVAPSYFLTQRMLDRYATLSESAEEHGTVGCAVLDSEGNLAAGTSTGGIMMKKYGRIGDSPIIAAGTWADNRTCAVSCTGQGEFFIRNAVAHEISALMMHAGLSLQEAADSVVQGALVRQNALGGIIAVDHDGNHCFSFNTNSMYRGVLVEGGEAQVKIFGN